MSLEALQLHVGVVLFPYFKPDFISESLDVLKRGLFGFFGIDVYEKG